MINGTLTFSYLPHPLFNSLSLSLHQKDAEELFLKGLRPSSFPSPSHYPGETGINVELPEKAHSPPWSPDLY
jgi:hypothetical protein